VIEVSEAGSNGVSRTMITRGIGSDLVPRPKVSGGGEEAQSVQIWALLHAVRRSWRIAVPLGILLAAVGSFVAWKSFIPKYSASAYLRVDADNSPLVFKTAEVRGGNYPLYKKTQQQLLVTPFVLNSALRDAEVAALPEIRDESDPIGWLVSSLRVTSPLDSEIMQVTVETVSKDACVKIVNAIVNAYMQEVVVEERNERLARLNRLEGVYAESEGKVRTKQTELKQLANVLGTGDSQSLTVAQQSAVSQFGMMQGKLADIQFDLMKAEGEMKVAQEAEQRMIAALESAEAANKEAGVEGPTELERLVVERTPEVIRLEADLASRKLAMRSALISLGASHPSVTKLRNEVAMVEEQLAIYRKEAKLRADLTLERTLAGGQVGGPNSRIVRTPGGQTFDMLGIAGKIEVLKNQEKMLQARVDTLSDETRKLGQSSIDVELMRSEIAGLEGVLRRVGQEIEQTSIELKTASRVKLLDPAKAASPPDKKKRLTRTAAVGLFGLMAPLGLLTLIDLSRKRASDSESVSTALALPAIGQIPMVSQRTLRDPDGASRRVQRERNLLENSIHGLTSMIMHCSREQQRRVFMVCSAMPGEGKSTVCCQLARGLARAGKKVVLVDFDFRSPSIDEYMNLPLNPGVADLLYQNLSLDEALQATDEPNLSVLTTGDWEGNLAERCSSGVVDELFETLRSRFDLVIVDGSPVLPVHDSRLIAKYTDGAILTLIRDHSRIPLASQACDLLRSFGIHVIGTILIGGYSNAHYSDYPRYEMGKSKKAGSGRAVVG